MSKSARIDQVRLLSRRLDELEAELASLQAEHASVKNQLAALLEPADAEDASEEDLPEEGLPEDQDLEDPDLDKSSKADLILDLIRKDPRLDYQAAAEAIYQERSPQAYRRVAALLTYLRKQGKIRNVGRARWEVVEAGRPRKGKVS